MDNLIKVLNNLKNSIQSEQCEAIKITYWCSNEKHILKTLKELTALNNNNSHIAATQIVTTIFNRVIKENRCFFTDKNLFFCFSNFFTSNKQMFPSFLLYFFREIETMLLEFDLYFEFFNDYLFEFTLKMIFLVSFEEGAKNNNDEDINRVVDINNSKNNGCSLFFSEDSLLSLSKSIRIVSIKILDFNYLLLFEFIVKYSKSNTCNFLELFLLNKNDLTTAWNAILEYLLSQILANNDFIGLEQFIPFISNLEHNEKLISLIMNNLFGIKNILIQHNINRKSILISLKQNTSNNKTIQNDALAKISKNLSKVLVDLEKFFSILIMLLETKLDNIKKSLSQFNNIDIDKNNAIIQANSVKNIIITITNYLFDMEIQNMKLITSFFTIIDKILDISNEHIIVKDSSPKNSDNSSNPILAIINSIDKPILLFLLIVSNEMFSNDVLVKLQSIYFKIYKKQITQQTNQKSTNYNNNYYLETVVIGVLINKIFSIQNKYKYSNENKELNDLFSINIAAISKSITLINNKDESSSVLNQNISQSNSVSTELFFNIFYSFLIYTKNNRNSNSNSNSANDNDNIKIELNTHSLYYMIKSLNCLYIEKISPKLCHLINKYLIVFVNEIVANQENHIINYNSKIPEKENVNNNSNNSTANYTLIDSDYMVNVKSLIQSYNRLLLSNIPDVEINSNGISKCDDVVIQYYYYNSISNISFIMINYKIFSCVYSQIRDGSSNSLSYVTLNKELIQLTQVSFKIIFLFSKLENIEALAKKLIMGLFNSISLVYSQMTTTNSNVNDANLTQLLINNTIEYKSIMIRLYADLTVLGDTTRLFPEFIKFNDDLLIKKPYMRTTIMRVLVYFYKLKPFFNNSNLEAMLLKRFETGINQLSNLNLTALVSSILDKSKNININELDNNNSLSDALSFDKNESLCVLNYTSIIFKILYQNSSQEDNIYIELNKYYLDFRYLKIIEKIVSSISSIKDLVIKSNISKEEEGTNNNDNSKDDQINTTEEPLFTSSFLNTTFQDLLVTFRNVSSLFSLIHSSFLNNYRAEINDSKRHENQIFITVNETCNYIVGNILDDDVINNSLSSKLALSLMDEFLQYENNVNFYTKSHSEEQALKHIQNKNLEFSIINSLTKEFSYTKNMKLVKLLQGNSQHFSEFSFLKKSIKTLIENDIKQITYEQGENDKTRKINDNRNERLCVLPGKLYKEQLNKKFSVSVDKSSVYTFSKCFFDILFSDISNIENNIEVFEFLLKEDILSNKKIFVLSEYINYEMLVVCFYYASKRCCERIEKEISCFDTEEEGVYNGLDNEHSNKNDNGTVFDISSSSAYLDSFFYIYSNNSNSSINIITHTENLIKTIFSNLNNKQQQSKNSNINNNSNSLIVSQTPEAKLANHILNNHSLFASQIQAASNICNNLSILNNYINFLLNTSDKEANKQVFESVLRTLSQKHFLEVFLFPISIYSRSLTNSEINTKPWFEFPIKPMTLYYSEHIEIFNKLEIETIKKLILYSSYKENCSNVIKDMLNALIEFCFEKEITVFAGLFEPLSALCIENRMASVIKPGFIDNTEKILIEQMERYISYSNYKDSGKQSHINNDDVNNDNNKDKASISTITSSLIKNSSNLLELVNEIRIIIKNKNSLLTSTEIQSLFSASDSISFLRFFVNEENIYKNIKSLNDAVSLLIEHYDISNSNSKNKLTKDQAFGLTSSLITYSFLDKKLLNTIIKILFNSNSLNLEYIKSVFCLSSLVNSDTSKIESLDAVIFNGYYCFLYNPSLIQFIVKYFSCLNASILSGGFN